MRPAMLLLVALASGPYLASFFVAFDWDFWGWHGPQPGRTGLVEMWICVAAVAGLIRISLLTKDLVSQVGTLIMTLPAAVPAAIVAMAATKGEPSWFRAVLCMNCPNARRSLARGAVSSISGKAAGVPPTACLAYHPARPGTEIDVITVLGVLKRPRDCPLVVADRSCADNASGTSGRGQNREFAAARWPCSTEPTPKRPQDGGGISRKAPARPR